MNIKTNGIRCLSTNFHVSTRKNRIHSKYRRQLQLNANRAAIQSNEMVNTLNDINTRENDEDEHAEKR